MDWLKKLLEIRSHDDRLPPQDPEALRREFDSFLCARLDSLVPNLTAIFEGLEPATLPAEMTHLHIEVFDDVGYELRLIGFGADGTEFFETAPEDRKVTSALAQVNAALGAHQPFVTQEEMDRFTLWETDPKFGQQHALEQPLDDYDAWSRLGPFLAEVTKGLRLAFSGDFTTGFHDRPQRPIPTAR
jgi:hypothetical protein